MVFGLYFKLMLSYVQFYHCLQLQFTTANLAVREAAAALEGCWRFLSLVAAMSPPSLLAAPTPPPAVVVTQKEEGV